MHVVIDRLSIKKTVKAKVLFYVAKVLFREYNSSYKTQKEELHVAKMLSVNEVAEHWNITATMVTRYCRNGRITGAVKEKGNWWIPEGTQKPGYGKQSTAIQPEQDQKARKPLPIGVSNYIETCSSYYYVDKTLLIQEFLDERPKVSLFTRPRRFGKTMTMDMLKTFFEISPKDNSVYFQDKKIWECAEWYREYQGKYPVIFLSFKDVKCSSWEETYDVIARLIQQEFGRHSELETSAGISNPEIYRKFAAGEACETENMMGLMYLSQMLDEHYGIAPIIIIDEYDTPIQQGHAQGFYDKIILFIRNFFSAGLKDNCHLSYGFLTGILRIAKESIFSGLNNLKINSILDEKYSQYFGFTADEVKQMAAYYGVPEKFEEICAWYDGYRFWHTEIFNPWSVINYFGNGCKPRPFWENTGSNTVICEILEAADEEVTAQLKDILQGEAVVTVVDTSVIYPELKNNPSSIYSFLLMAGYLKLAQVDMADSGDYICSVALPNREIAYVYKKEIISKLSRAVSQGISTGIQKALFLGDGQLLKKYLHAYLLESVSSFDLTNENAYHMLLLGMCAVMSDKYYISSNRESGEGRFDIQLMPKSSGLPGVLIELKADKRETKDNLAELSQRALRQIDERRYATEMQQKGIGMILEYGVAFCGKAVEVSVK